MTRILTITPSESWFNKSASVDWAKNGASILSASKRPSVDSAASDRNRPKAAVR
jgi:hypothetical protein